MPIMSSAKLYRALAYIEKDHLMEGFSGFLGRSEGILHELAHTFMLGQVKLTDSQIGIRLRALSAPKANAMELSTIKVQVAAARRLAGHRWDPWKLQSYLDTWRSPWKGGKPTEEELERLLNAPLTHHEELITKRVVRYVVKRHKERLAKRDRHAQATNTRLETPSGAGGEDHPLPPG